MAISTLGSKKILISVISADILYAVSAECDYQRLVTKIWNGGRMSCILTNFIPNIGALNSKHFTY